ncbi:hypothetical protein [Ruicaihuangia caeni]|uniref:hypothetical protein n=1 Tax=Ruicaihuangia caeni TaxID=3042517 RepID=UPI0033907377
MQDTADTQPDAPRSGIRPSNWSRHISGILLQVADLLEQAGEEAWELPSMHRGWSIREVAGLLVWRLGTSPQERVRAYSRTMLDTGSAAQLGLARAAAKGALPPVLRDVAASRASGRRRGSLPALTAAVIGALDIATALGATISISPVVSEAVARSRAMSAPVALRTVLRRNTLKAADAGWQVGRGPVITGDAAAILLVMFGRTALPTDSVSDSDAGPTP